MFPQVQSVWRVWWFRWVYFSVWVCLGAGVVGPGTAAESGQEAAADAGAAGRLPNVIFILVDDMGFGDLGCYGNVAVSTPHIDGLAREGMRFTSFYAASPICSPSRVGFMTGQQPARWRIHSYLNDRASNRALGMADWLDPKAPSVARAFQEAGYATAHFGKWHMGGGRDVGDAPLPEAYGFDESLTSFEGLGDRVLPPGGLSERSAKLGRGRIDWVLKHELTGIYVERALGFMRAHRAEPFLVHLWLSDVHDEHEPSAADLAALGDAAAGLNEYERKFRAVLQAMDREIGRLLAGLDELGLREETIVMLAGDNGPTAWPRYYREGVEPPGSTGGLRGRKWSLYEGGIRTPFIIRWPGEVPAGVVNEETVLGGVDWFPSVCALTGVAAPEGVVFDGEDLSGAFRGEKVERQKRLFWDYGRMAKMLRPGAVEDRSPALAVREGDWKLLMNGDGRRVELYNLAADREESRNLTEEQPERTARLQKALMEWKETWP